MNNTKEIQATVQQLADSDFPAAIDKESILAIETNRFSFEPLFKMALLILSSDKSDLIKVFKSSGITESDVVSLINDSEAWIENLQKQIEMVDAMKARLYSVGGSLSEESLTLN